MTSNVSNDNQVNREELLSVAEKIGRIGEAEALEAEKNATLSKKVIEAIQDAQINKSLVPKRYGGLEVDLRTYTKMIQTVARYSPAAAWLTYFYSIHNVWVSYLPPKGREEIFTHGGLIADIFAPVGKVERDEDDYLLSGRWDFVSGVLHSDWIGLGAIMQLQDGEKPEYCMLTVKASDIEIEKNWDALGLRATGSHRVIAERVRVPAHRVVRLGAVAAMGRPFDDDFDKNELVYQLPLFSFFHVGFAFVALGAAERLLAEFKERTLKRTRVYEGGASEKESPRSQRVLAELKSQFFAAEGLMDRHVRLLEEYQQDGPITNEGDDQFGALRTQAVKITADIAVKVLLTLGGTAVFKGDPVELLTRDILTLATHMSNAYEDRMALYGKKLLAVETSTLSGINGQ